MSHLPVQRRAAGVVLALVLLSACSVGNPFQSVTPQSLEEGVAAGYITLANANSTFAGLVKPPGGVFTKEQVQQISDALDSAGVLLRSARQCVKTNDLAAGEDYLKLADNLLEVINGQLGAKQ